MAKYTVSHSCGHDQVHDLLGKSAVRDRKQVALAGRPCSDCYLAARECDRAAANARAAEQARALGLPELQGRSPKAIAWAESLRLPAAVNLAAAEAEILADLAEEGLSETAVAEVRDAVALIRSEALGQVDAGWWIDRRDTLVHDLANRFASHLKGQLRDRGLAPTLEAERRARIEAEKAAAATRRARLGDAIAGFDAAAATLEIGPDGRSYAARHDGVTIAYRPRIFEISDRDGEVAAVYFDGLDRYRRDLGPALRDAYDAAVRIAHEARKAARHASLAGVSVASAAANRKRAGNLLVTLSDGRTMAGDFRVKAGCVLTFLSDEPVDSDAPEVLRIAAEASKVVARG